MSGSTLGTLFTVTTFGESHGPAIGCVIDGFPPGLELREADIQPDLDRRKPGTSGLTVVATGVPVGWGAPIYDRLDADIAKVMMGINAAKGVEIGAGFRSVEQLGTEHGDEMTPEGFLSNNAGGIFGGIEINRYAVQAHVMSFDLAKL